MAETGNLALPLLASGQAQKHVTVNEALTRLDLLVMLGVKSRSLAAPPPAAASGERHIVASGAGDAWAGHARDVAVRINGGWDFVTPQPGWRAYVEDESAEVVFGSGVWSALTAPPAVSGVLGLLEFEHVLGAGGAQTTDGLIPAGALVFGVTARVLQAVAGVSAWSLGVAEAPTRYGADLPITTGAGISGARGAPLAYTSALPLLVSPKGGVFTGGRIRFLLHYLTLGAPAA